MKFFFFLSLVFISWSVSAQRQFESRYIDSSQYVSKIDSLNDLYGENKVLLPEYKLVILIALSYYPELSDADIVFTEKKISTTLNSRPNLFSLPFKHRNKRSYIIRINNQKRDSVIHLLSAPFNAKVGVFAHELAHIVDYESRNIFRLFSRLLDYVTPKSKAKYEKEIDTIVIERGLGWQLYDWAYFVLRHSHATRSYKKFKRSIYLTPQEIRNLINSHLQLKNNLK
ncbi:MAG: hypothetical protein PF481_06445 [Bacteroidales bacterium]|jgi:hypothetical protein|nr:hypothetical protein [Bacteroidales bacterium]